jgi:hypothetical protein
MVQLPDDELANTLRASVLQLLGARRRTDTIDIHDAARSVALKIGCDWRDLMRPLRTVATTMIDDGILDATQGDAAVDIRHARGPVRLRLRDSLSAQPA